MRAAAVIGATAIVLASSCTWQLSLFIPDGVPPPAGDAVPAVDTHASGRPADQLREWAQQRSAALEIPVIALEAYAYAARVAEVENPKCHIAWTTLAGIGQVESHHGTYRGARLAPNGDVSPPIRGVRLDGSGGTLRIVDTEEDVTDGRRRDARHGADAVHPGDVAALRCRRSQRRPPSARTTSTTPRSRRPVICVGAERISRTPRGWITALRAYNNSGVYARAVRDWATAYAKGHPL